MRVSLLVYIVFHEPHHSTNIRNATNSKSKRMKKAFVCLFPFTNVSHFSLNHNALGFQHKRSLELIAYIYLLCSLTKCIKIQRFPKRRAQLLFARRQFSWLMILLIHVAQIYQCLSGHRALARAQLNKTNSRSTSSTHKNMAQDRDGTMVMFIIARIHMMSCSLLLFCILPNNITLGLNGMFPVCWYTISLLSFQS